MFALKLFRGNRYRAQSVSSKHQQSDFTVCHQVQQFIHVIWPIKGWKNCSIYYCEENTLANYINFAERVR